MTGKWVKRVGYALLIAAVLVGLAVPTEFMSDKEAFFARFVVIAPVCVFGLLFLALGRIIRLMEFSLGVTPSAGCCGGQSKENKSCCQSKAEAAPELSIEDALAEALNEELEAPVQEPKADLPKMPVEVTPSTEEAVKTGEIAGRKYRLFADGSLEIDTNQSTIRFDSMDEFRQFIQNPDSDNTLGEKPKE